LEGSPPRGEPGHTRGRAAARSVKRHGGGGARRTVFRMAGFGAALLLVVLLVHGLRRAGPRDGGEIVAGPQVLVEGEVGRPGAVALEPDANLADVIEAAEGAVDELDPEALRGDARAWTRITVSEGRVTVTELSPGERFALGGTLDPNLASAEELAEVPGLSDELAARVIEEREDVPFCAIAELERVRGIGPRKIEWIRPFLSIDGVAAGCLPTP